MKEITQAQFEQLIKRAWAAYDRFEKKAVYKDGNSHDLEKGQDEWDKYANLMQQVEGWRDSHFPWWEKHNGKIGLPMMREKS